MLDATLASGQGGGSRDQRAAADFGALEPRDRGFARALYGLTLRHLGEIDAGLAPYLRRKPPLPLLNVLRVGVCQIRLLRTPAHAAVGETVALAPPGGRGLVNAVLRRLATAEPADLDPVALNTPSWLRARWERTYGGGTARAVMAAHLLEPPLDLSVKADHALWAERLGGRLLPNGTVRLEGGGAVEALPGFEEGAWWVQDVAASLPARILGDVRGRRVLDLCAAPGGKTAQLAAAGAAVTAVERDPARLALLRANLARVGLDAETAAADALAYEPAEPFPFVLLDAPCTATGTVRRHPDIPWTRRPDDVGRIAARQGPLLDAALRLLAPGGVLAYAVCSLEPEEGELQIEAALGRHPGLRRCPIGRNDLGGLPLTPTAGGDLRTLPCDMADEGGMDGFFVARLGID